MYVPSKKRTLGSNARRDRAGSRNVLFNRNQPANPHVDAPTHSTLHHAKALSSYIRKLGVLNQYHRCALRNIRRRCPYTHSQQHPPVHLRTRLVTSEQHDRLRLHRNPLPRASFPKRDILSDVMLE